MYGLVINISQHPVEKGFIKRQKEGYIKAKCVIFFRMLFLKETDVLL